MKEILRQSRGVNGFRMATGCTASSSGEFCRPIFLFCILRLEELLNFTEVGVDGILNDSDGVLLIGVAMVVGVTLVD